MLILRLLFVLSLILGLGACTPSPMPEKFNLPPPREENPITPSQTLKLFQEQLAESDSYLLGAGDEITLEVWGYTDLSGKHTVGPDGKITLPLVGEFRVAELSRSAAAQAIVQQYNKYYSQLKANVRVDRYASNRVLVLGRVNKPGDVLFGMTAPTLLESIALAGGILSSRSLSGAGGVPALGGEQSLVFSRCAVFRGRDQIVWIELAPLLSGKDLSLNIKLRRNDIVYVPEAEDKLVYVLGEVRTPGAYRLTPNMSFLELLSKAGGPTREAASGRINLIRPKQNINEEIGFDDLVNPNPNLNVALQEGDVIYVPLGTVAKINYAMQILTPFSAALGVYSDITSIQANSQRLQLDKDKSQLEKDRAALEAEKARAAGFQ